MDSVNDTDDWDDSPLALQQIETMIWFSKYKWTIIAMLLCTILLFTRLATTVNAKLRATGRDGSKIAPTVPYWLPVFGHIPNMAFNADGFMRSLRDMYTDGIFTLHFGGSRHNIVYSPDLATAILNQKSDHANHHGVSKRIMRFIFGFPGNEIGKYDAAIDEINACYRHLQSGSGLGKMIDQTIKRTKENINSLVTFMGSPVDQMPWEKRSDIEIVDRPHEDQAVEASLLPLIRDFCAFTANPTIMGSDFLENNPDFFNDLWILDRGFLLLGTGLPRWAPIPTLTRAHIARRNNLQRLEAFHEVLEKHWNGEDPGPKWSSLDDVGDLLKARMDVYRRHELSIRARASLEHALMWAANANSDILVFWLINRIYEDRALLAMLREEIAPYVIVEQVKSGLPIAEPPHITKLDIDGLCEKCPLLKSCYIESLRLDSASWSFKSVKQDFVLHARDKGSTSWLLRKGEYVHVAHDLHNTNPNYFKNPTVWKADRHINYDEKKTGTADLGTIRPYGGGESMCKGRAFAFREVMMFTAAIISMWDIEPAGGGSKWKMPKHAKATSVHTTHDDTRVWVKPRKIPSDG